MADSRQIIRIIFFPRERFPTFRGRIDVLFGRELLPRGHHIDLVMQANDESIRPGVHPWGGRSVSVGPVDTGSGFAARLRKHLLGIGHDLRGMWRADRKSYDGVLVSDKFLIAAVALILCRMRRLKFLFWLTFPEHEAQLLRAANRTARYPALAWVRGRVSSWLLYRFIIPGSDHVFVQSPQMAINLRKSSKRAPGMTPIVTGVDLGDFPRSCARNSNGGRSFVIGYLGTLDAERRPDVLVETLAILREQNLDTRLLIVGGGDKAGERESIEERAAELGVSPHVEITGFLPRSAALERIRHADVGVSPFFPSRFLEVASPTKLIEYLALGLPVVANDQPEQRLIVRSSRAGLCVPWGPRYFARAIRWIMNLDPMEQAAMGDRGRAWVEDNRTYARIADDFERACSAVLPH